MYKIAALLLLAAFCSATRNCGIIRNNKIYGGDEAAPHAYPWMVSLSTSKGFHSCGGSLIDNQWVLTAGHCVTPGRTHYLRLGYHDLSNDEEGTMQITVPGENIFRHESYSNPIMYDNDITLIKLPEPIEFSDTVDRICMPTDDMAGMDVEGVDVVITGWGYIEGMSLPNKLYVAFDKGMSPANCASYYEGYQLTERMMCMHGDSGKQCNGDSGGPVSEVKDGNCVQLGIVSFSQKKNGQCFMHYPAVQAFIPNLLDWVKEKSGLVFE